MAYFSGTDKELCQQIAANDYHYFPGPAFERQQRNPSAPNYGLAQFNTLVKALAFSFLSSLPARGFHVIMHKNYFQKGLFEHPDKINAGENKSWGKLFITRKITAL